MIFNGLSAQNSVIFHRAETFLNDYFLSYSAKNTDFTMQPRLKDLAVDEKAQTVTVITTEYFAQQKFSDKQVGRIYKQV
ncbi:MAG: hypothetical protein PHU58_08300, partial [Prevotella sp.]|nr:hypothetical protein [Prevotella sp.]